MMKDLVRAANKQFYNCVGSHYEMIDGRRRASLEDWLKQQLRELSRITRGGVLLDLGCGSGLVTRCAQQYFRKCYGVDLAERQLSAGNAICADAAQLPLTDGVVDVVVCFSTLHHIYDYYSLIGEIHRVLKPGGIFYSDHDLALSFARRFKIPLRLYRYFFRPAQRYLDQVPGVNEDLYHLSEVHSQGIDEDTLRRELSGAGFEKIKTFYHWYGLHLFSDKFFGTGCWRRGWAPLVRVRAQKELWDRNLH